MPSDNFDQFDRFDELDDLDTYVPRMKNAPGKKKRLRPRLKDKYGIITEEETAQQIFIQREDIRFEDFTYQPSETEQTYLINSLGGFFDQRWFDDILKVIKGGKEASVYLAKGSNHAGEDYLAAKVYRPRMFRALKNDQMYREGRAYLDEDGLAIVNDAGQLKALSKRTKYGKELEHTSWIEHEVRTMEILLEAGCDVPNYFASSKNAILMTYVGDPELPAPTLNDVSLDGRQAARLFRRVMDNVQVMLDCGRVHGDLSAYNILYWEGEITLIDFPQAINPERNPNAYEIFHRDVRRVCEYFQRQGVSSKPDLLARQLWQSRGLRTGPKIDLKHLNPDDEKDRAFWDNRG